MSRAARMSVALLLEVAAIFLLLLVALGRPWPTGHRDVSVYVAVDRSASVEPEALGKALDDVAATLRNSQHALRLYTIDFAGKVAAARTLASTSKQDRASPSDALDVASTNIEHAIDAALTRTVAAPSALIMLSDGNDTEGDVKRGLEAAAEAGTPVLWHSVGGSPSTPRIAEVLAPGNAQPRQAVGVSVRLAGVADHALRLTLTDPAGRIEPVVTDVAPGRLGMTPLTFRTGATGTLLLDVSLDDPSSGGSLDRRRAAAAIDVQPPASLLYVASEPAPLAQSLRAGGWSVEEVAPEVLDDRVESFDRYAAIVLDDVPVTAARPATWSALDLAVRERGTGLLVLGGSASFAAGSYAGSRLEDLLPVQSKPGALGSAAAIAFVVDKSGSMGASSAGVDRFRLAQRAVVETAATLTDRDSAALIVFDVDARVLLPLQSSADFRRRVAQPWAAQPRGGTRLTPAIEAALQQLAGAAAKRRILLLVTDGFVEEAPDEALRARLASQGIELIALAIGPDADVGLLSRLVPAGERTVLRVQEAAELPDLMRQGLERRRAPIERGRIGVQVRRPAPFLPADAGAWPPVAAYDVTMAAPDAVIYLESLRGDPLLASRQVGLGHVVALTSGLGAWTPGWLGWRQWPALAGGLLVWVSALEREAGPTLRATDFADTLEVDVDSAEGGAWSAPAGRRLRVTSPAGRVEELPLVPSGPGRSRALIQNPMAGLYVFELAKGRGSSRLLHLREPRRELGPIGPNPAIAHWRDSGLIRDATPDSIRQVLGKILPSTDARPNRAIALALGLFLLALLVERLPR